MKDRDLGTEEVPQLMVRPQVASVSGPIIRKRRERKHRLTWEQGELAAGGGYAQTLAEIETRHPELSLMECRVCALAKAMLPNWKIAQTLGICEKTVENHLRSTRIKLGLPPGTKMHRVLGF